MSGPPTNHFQNRIQDFPYYTKNKRMCNICYKCGWMFPTYTHLVCCNGPLVRIESGEDLAPARLTRQQAIGLSYFIGPRARL